MHKQTQTPPDAIQVGLAQDSTEQHRNDGPPTLKAFAYGISVHPDGAPITHKLLIEFGSLPSSDFDIMGPTQGL